MRVYVFSSTGSSFRYSNIFRLYFGTENRWNSLITRGGCVHGFRVKRRGRHTMVCHVSVTPFLLLSSRPLYFCRSFRLNCQRFFTGVYTLGPRERPVYSFRFGFPRQVICVYLHGVTCLGTHMEMSTHGSRPNVSLISFDTRIFDTTPHTAPRVKNRYLR